MSGWQGTQVLAGDLLLNITGGSIGRCCQVPDDFGEANVSQHVAIIRPVVKEMGGFLHRLILSPYFQAFIFDEQTGAGRGGLPKNRMDRIPVAVPPLAEQRRIVAKIEELMRLCERLELSRAEREAFRDSLTEASLARLNTPDRERFRDYALFALNVFPALTVRADQITPLRQSILDLAARGKLTLQDPNDGSSDDVVQRIRLQARKVKQVIGVEKYLDVPPSWAWARINEVGVTQTGKTPTSSKPDLFGTFDRFHS